MPKTAKEKITQTDLLVLKELRVNARSSMAHISRKTGIPVSTIFDKIKSLEKKLIAKHSTIADFSLLGFGIHAHYAVKANNKLELKAFLEGNAYVNSLFRTNNGTDFFIDAFFKDMKQRNFFIEGMEDCGIQKLEEFFVSEEIIKEMFLTLPEHIFICKKE